MLRLQSYSEYPKAQPERIQSITHIAMVLRRNVPKFYLFRAYKTKLYLQDIILKDYGVNMQFREHLGPSDRPNAQGTTQFGLGLLTHLPSDSTILPHASIPWPICSGASFQWYVNEHRSCQTMAHEPNLVQCLVL